MNGSTKGLLNETQLQMLPGIDNMNLRNQLSSLSFSLADYLHVWEESGMPPGFSATFGRCFEK